ncbi:MAG: hypothetical protein LC667_20735 [Thioalkalivibrio sp.]|nr:hypothetical protein [Thioalkalivibrio sp.]
MAPAEPWIGWREVARMAVTVAAVVVAGGVAMTLLGLSPMHSVFAAVGAVLAVSLAARRRSMAGAEGG